MLNEIYGVYGASGYGREVMPVARETLARLDIDPGSLFFIDDKPGAKTLNDCTVLSYDEFNAREASAKHIAVAIADSAIRADIFRRILSDGNHLWTLQAGNVVSMDNVELGSGAILSPFVTITSNVVIGSGFHANIYSYVAHDCKIGDFVTFAPGVKCNGNVVIDDFAYVGTGAMIKQGQPGKPMHIGRGAVVGMGAVVTRDVPDGAIVVGNPAKSLKK